MRATSLIRDSVRFAVLAILAFSLTAGATTIAVDCGAKKDNSINAALASLVKQGPHIINITGTCNENVFIENFDDVTLAGSGGASINFVPGPDSFQAIFVTRSRSVTIHDLIINGGLTDAIVCGVHSNCVFYNLTVQGSSGNGISFARATGTIGDNTVLQNNVVGAAVIRNSHVRFGRYPGLGGVTIINNGNATDGGDGIVVDDQSYVDLLFSTVQGNAYGNGITANIGSFIGLAGSTITGNGGVGVSVGPSSTLRLRPGGGPNVITGNGGSGVVLSHLSFLQIGGPRTISGNGVLDVDCAKSTAKTQGTGGSAAPNLGGGTTNCTEPAP
jgi:hypothetical protein